ncbi:MULTISPECIES: ATP-binding protein [Burkholderia]|uniref:AAA ATPase n=1 Tax=Burkholderia aenigmatica TaxID=2015348 RepID=A0A6J5JNH4_9BURK|nr:MULTISPECIES: ATP-binding protein [Burkholderia]CAB3972910.1 AAA ATPase [Burkholderia aenigmatica]
MTAIDFTRIRSNPKSRNDSFEALAVQLFRSTCKVPTGSTFVSLRGDGGDGGVEAYFRTPSGAVLGIQAKYFFQLGSAELDQIDGSLQAALDNHPNLSEYWVYIPFDLTGRVAAGKRGKSQAERFEEWKRKVEAEAANRGSTLSITLCAAAIIRSQLLDLDPHGGMRRYWFDDSILTASQIQHCLDQAIAFAGPRYTAALDIVTSAHTGLDFFGGIGNFQAWRDESLAPVMVGLRALKGWGNEALSILNEPLATKARKLIGQVMAASERITSVSVASAEVVEAIRAISALLPLLEKARDAQEQDFYKKHGRECDTPGFRQFHAEYMCDFPAGNMDAARDWGDSILRLQSVLASQEIGAATTHSLLLVGPAGIGKTHAIVSAALRRQARGGQSLVVFGDDFGKAEPWEVIRSKLGFGASVGRETLLESLQACAEHTGLPFVIYIDALNESPRNARWKDKLPEFLTQCKPYADVKVCVSARDTYRDLVVDSRFPGFAFEHVGFSGQEFEAVQAFAAYYGLDAEITPLFSPELSNPLFLRLACQTLKEEGRDSLDVSLPGFTALLESHLKYCDALVRGRLKYSNPRNLVRAAMMRLAETLTHNLPQERTWDACIAALLNLVGAELAPEALLKELEYEGLVILSSEEGDTWFVRLGYQRYGDMLRAISLIDGVMQPSGVDIEALAKKLGSLSAADDGGLLEALAAVLPEKTGVEITSSALELDSELAHRLFINGLPWRSRASITYGIDDHVRGALFTPHLWQQVYEVFFRLSLVPGHRLNASNWLGPFLRQSSMVDRDAYLSVAAFKSFDAKGAVWSLINAVLRADIDRWPEESRRLATVALAWLTSCADRRVRDLSAKGLTRLVASQPELGRALAEEFRDCDDDYILESISLAVYSACLLERGRRIEFIPALDGLLSPAFAVPNILVRDSVRLLGRLLKDVGLPEQLARRLDTFPGRATAPLTWPTLDDAQPLLALDGLPSNMNLWDPHIGPDFWRYQVESKIHGFDLEGAGISRENIACWLMVGLLRLGYPGYKECALHTDRAISGQFGTGRSRKGYADRLGKKYYWILLHRLVGILADNVPPRQDSFSDWAPGEEHLWSVDVRKVDLTDVRDISPQIDYPDELLQGPRYVFPDQSTGDIKLWVRTDDFTPYAECIVRTARTGDEWVALSLSASDDDRSPGEDSWSKPHLGVRLFYTSIFVDGAIPALGGRGAGRDAFDSQGASCYRGYLAEYPDGPVFDQVADEGSFYRGPKGMLFSAVTLARRGEWEYDYSYTTPERQEHLSVPCQDLVRLLGLQWDRQRGWVDSGGELVAFESDTKRRNALFIRRSSLNQYLEVTGKKLMYRRFANRGFFKNGGPDGSQIDLFTWLLYRPKGGPDFLQQDARPYNC